MPIIIQIKIKYLVFTNHLQNHWIYRNMQTKLRKNQEKTNFLEPPNLEEQELIKAEKEIRFV